MNLIHIRQVYNFKVRADAVLTEFFYNETQRAFAETRIIREKLRLEFLGTQPFSIKPEMLFEGQGIRILMTFYSSFFSIKAYSACFASKYVAKHTSL